MKMMQQQLRTNCTAGELLQEILPVAEEWAAVPVAGIAMDHREIGPGYLFIACSGSNGHGLDYLAQALQRGAVMVLAEVGDAWTPERIQRIESPVPVLPVQKLRSQTSEIAARFYAHPARSMRIAGVTGTNGKTSVSLFLARALPSHWHCVVTGTTGNGFPDQLQPATHTTPDAVHAQRLLAQFKHHGAKTAVMEVSSHALDQYRLEAVPFHTAVFTNLTRDHLDYHGSMLAYAAAKKRLFERPELQLAVMSSNDSMAVELMEQLYGSVRVVACHTNDRKLQSDEFIRLLDLQQNDAGMRLSFNSSWGEAEINSKLIGDFNATNLMLALGVMLAWDVPLQEAVQGLESLPPVPGRMQHFGGEGRPLVVVDYAHTPDALQKALTTLRGHTRGRLRCVFGCGGDRDRGKRSQMGALAEALADNIILTDDNPRREPSVGIIADILEGMQQPRLVQVIADRREAIQAAIDSAAEDDVILVAGKGHESWQQVGDQKLPFSDLETVAEILEQES